MRSGAPLVFCALFLLLFFANPGRAEQIEPRWAFDLPAPVEGAPVVAARRVWVGLVEGEILGLDPDTGEEVARHRLSDRPLSSPVFPGAGRLWWSEGGGALRSWLPSMPTREPDLLQLNGELRGRPLSDRGALYATTASSLYRIPVEGVRTLAPQEWSLEGVPCGPLALGGGLVAVALCNGTGKQSIQLLDDRTGERVGRSLPIKGEISGMALNADRLVVAFRGGDWHGYRLRPGRGAAARRVWRRKTGLGIRTVPLLWGERTAVLGLDNWVHVARAKDGNLLHRVRLPYQSEHAPAWLPGGRLAFAMRGTGEIARADLYTGSSQLLWRTDRPQQVLLSAPAVDPARGLLVAVEGPWTWRVLGFPTEPLPDPPSEDEGGEDPQVAGEEGPASEALEEPRSSDSAE